MSLYNFKRILNPAWFQGNGKRKNYFEGWYFKIVSAVGKHTWAFIPGISYGNDSSHSFIQVINGMTGQTWYFKFELDAFSYSRNSFSVQVAGSHFSDNGFKIKLIEGNDSFEGEVSFEGVRKFPVSLLRPGIMGYYRYIPFMECYHGVVSLDHKIKGGLVINGEDIDFTGGKGYIEKDWGTSMPMAWIWMQTNHFDDPGISFMLSVARIPWIGNSFTGFLGFFLHEGRLYQFATYTGAKIRTVKTDGDWVEIVISSREFSIQVQGKKKLKGALKAPVAGDMDRVIHESVNAELLVKLMDKHGNILFEGIGRNAGLELVGDLMLLQ